MAEPQASEAFALLEPLTADGADARLVAMSVAAVVREASARADRPSPEAEGSKEPAAAAPRAASWTGTKEALAATAAVEAAVAAAAAAAVGSAAADAAWTTASHDGGGPAAEGSAGEVDRWEVEWMTNTPATHGRGQPVGRTSLRWGARCRLARQRDLQFGAVMSTTAVQSPGRLSMCRTILTSNSPSMGR